MRCPLNLSLLGLLLLGAGSTAASPAAESAASTASIALPARFEGFLIIEASDGDVDAAGTHENNFGTLTVGKREFAVQVSGGLLARAALPAAGGKVRATLGSRSDEFGFALYEVTALERL